jgi:hypothetical protein
MSDSYPIAEPSSEGEPDCRAKVFSIFRELLAERADSLCDGLCVSAVADAISVALRRESDMSAERAKDIGFHLSDWHADAAFIVALHLRPERFTPAEIEDGVMSFLFHAPNHVAAAAALFGHPIDDIFEVGALNGPSADG